MNSSEAAHHSLMVETDGLRNVEALLRNDDFRRRRFY